MKLNLDCTGAWYNNIIVLKLPTFIIVQDTVSFPIPFYKEKKGV
jgi:hypothetical protein